jgi:hypothetical protein
MLEPTMTLRPKSLLFPCVGLAVLFSSWDTGAVGTRRFVLRDGKDFEGGELKGTAVDSTGKVQAGFNLGSTPVSEGTTLWCALPLKDGSLLLGTGNEGKLLRYAGAKVQVVAETHALIVTTMVEAWGGAVALGVVPGGKVLKWDQGKLTDLAKLEGAEDVWQLAFDPKANALYAATGPEGKLFRITADGKAQVYFDAEEEHLMSVAVAPNGTVYAGAGDKAKLYQLSAPGRANVLRDFERTEVRSIVVNPKGEVYAIANEITSGSSIPATKSSPGSATAGPVRTTAKTKGKGTLYRFASDGTPEQLLDLKDEHLVSLALGDDGKPYVGTGVEGKVYTVDQNHNSVLVADTPERQVTALVLKGTHRFVASSDPAVLHPVRGVGGNDAVWTSKVLDAGLRAHFGRMRWDSTGKLEISTRTGNAEQPDDTWSGWGKPLTAPDQVPSPAARYLQIRARFNQDPSAVLSEVEIPFVTDNLRAVLTSIEAKGGANTVNSSTGIEKSGGPITPSADGKVNLSWQVDNPDRDELRFRLAYRIVGTTQWYDILEPHERLTKESYTWDTSAMPEGLYRIRVTVSDELSNPPARALRHELLSGVVMVDNTPPVLQGLKVNGRRVQGVALDGVGPIERIELSIIGSDEWYPFFPVDGVFDEAEEEFDADLAVLSPSGPALVAIRTFDRAGNSVVKNVALK